MKPFALSIADRQSSTWNRIKKHLEEQLRVEREKNDAPTLTPERTAYTRGRIAVIKELLALDQPQPAPVEDP